MEFDKEASARLLRGKGCDASRGSPGSSLRKVR